MFLRSLCTASCTLNRCTLHDTTINGFPGRLQSRDLKSIPRDHRPWQREEVEKTFSILTLDISLCIRSFDYVSGGYNLEKMYMFKT